MGSDGITRMTTLKLVTPDRYRIGLGLVLTIERVYPSLVGFGYDRDDQNGEHKRVAGVGLHWCFVTVAVHWWKRKPRKVKDMDPDVFLKRNEISRKEADETELQRRHAAAVWRGHEEEQIRWIRGGKYRPLARLFEELRRARFELQELGEPLPTCKCGAVLWLHVEGPIKCDKCRRKQTEKRKNGGGP